MERDRRVRISGHGHPEVLILIATLGIALAVAIPKYTKSGALAALAALVLTAAAIIGGIVLLILGIFLFHNAEREGTGWRIRTLRWAGHAVRVLVFALCGMILGMPAVAFFREDLGPTLEGVVSFGVVGGTGLLGAFLYHRLGRERFVPAFGKFALAMVCSLVGLVAGMVVFDDSRMVIGLLIPLLAFVILAAMGKIVPPQPTRKESEPPR